MMNRTHAIDEAIDATPVAPSTPAINPTTIKTNA